MSKSSLPATPQPIKVGDLVLVVRPKKCCGNARAVGQVFRVSKITGGTSRCIYCSADINSPEALDPSDDHYVEVERLKRIPPLDELEVIKTEEDLREPA